MIGILLIATRKYKVFIKPLLEQIDKFFLPKEELTVFLFIDEIFDFSPHDYDFIIRRIKIPPYRFPQATLYRYKEFYEHSEWFNGCSHLYYLDADSAIVDVVGTEILVDGLMAVRHPGFWASDGWGSEGNPENSTSWFPAEQRKHYYCGGTQGGLAENYIEACRVLAERIEEDERNGVIAIHNDETHWNRWCNVDKPELVYEFDSGYCLVEQIYLRDNWGLSQLKPRILALSKDHSEIRS